MSLQYVEDSTFVQVKPPSWGKNFCGEVDTCSLVFQGAQYREKAFLNGLTKYQALVYVDEQGTSTTDNGMRLIKWASDESPILPSVTLYYEGLRNSGAQDPEAEDDITVQTASTTFTITDATSVNYKKAITMTITYRAARTTYTWTALSNPGATPTYTTVRKPIVLTLYGANILITRCTGMVDASGDPTNTIPIGDATAVWNSFIGQTQTTSFPVKEVVPGYVWSCQSVNEFLMQGT